MSLGYGPDFCSELEMKVFPTSVFWMAGSAVFEVAFEGLRVGIMSEQVHGWAVSIFYNDGKYSINVGL
jgi:hypothetical protein